MFIRPIYMFVIPVQRFKEIFREYFSITLHKQLKRQTVLMILFL